MINQKNNEVGFEHLHLHTDKSCLDGFGMCHEYSERATKINQKFLCVTDHGTLGAVPSQIRACEEDGLTPIFGIEYYYQPNHPSSKSEFQAMDAEQKSAIKKSYHLTAIAHNEIGFRNLVRGSSWAWINGFYYKPRINKEMLLKHKEGITFFSGCYNSPVGQAFNDGGKEAADEQIKEFMEMFGEHFYLEIMLLDFHKQKPYDVYLIDAAERFNLPIVVSNDCHVCLQEDIKYQRYCLMIAKKSTIKDIEDKLALDEKAEIFEKQDPNLWMKSEQEINEMWFTKFQDVIPFDVLTKAKENTVKICQKAKGVQLDRTVKLPQLPDADIKLKEALVAGFISRGLQGKREYEKRLKEEYELIRRKEYSSYFMIQKQIIDESRRVGSEILGFEPSFITGRGSAAGSLACYCLGITGIDPIENDLLFSRFLSENRGGKSLRTKFTREPIGKKIN